MPLGEASVVHRSKSAHTLFQPLSTIMDRQPTLLILAPPAYAKRNALPKRSTLSASCKAIEKYGWMENAIHTGLNCNLPVLLVAPNNIGECAHHILPGNNIIDIQINDATAHLTELDIIAQFISAGVSASPNAEGWLVTPANMGIAPETIQRMANHLRYYPLISAQCNQVTGFPLAFSSEFYSELTQLRAEKDLKRLINRYPTHNISVNDPDVLLNQPKASYTIDHSVIPLSTNNLAHKNKSPLA